MNPRILLSCLLLAATTWLTIPTAGAASPEGVRFLAELVWGTNGSKPPEKDLKPIKPELEKALRRIFKWQNYFEISRKEFEVSGVRPARVDMSKECRLEVTRLTEQEYEIQLFGKGVLVVTKRQRVLPGETVVLGGDDKNDNAWFVVLSLARVQPGRR